MLNPAISKPVAAVLLALGLAACDDPAEQGKFTGYVEAEFVYVAAPDSGWLAKAPLREGDDVAQGSVLFELDQDRQKAEVAEAADKLDEAEAQARDISTGSRREEIAALEAQLREAKASLVLARAERIRWMELVAQGYAPKARGDQADSEFQTATAKVRTAQANIRVARLAGRDAARDAAKAKRDAAAAVLAQAEWRLGQRTVRARVGGRVEEVFHRAGEYVTAGSPVLSLLPPGALKVRFFVPQARLSDFAPGKPVEVLIDSRPNPVLAKTSHVAREAEFTPPVIYSVGSREKLVFLVEARLDDPSAARPGQPVDVRLP